MESNVKVLVVDDDLMMVKTMCEILRIRGYETTSAHSGEEALESIRREKPDCVLMDIRMPGMGGVEAVHGIRRSAPDLPVILMSACPTEEQTVEAKRHGAYSVLTKPVDLQLILAFLALLRREKSILLVDDDTSFCRDVRDTLQTRGYRVESVIDPDLVMFHMERYYRLAVILDLKAGDADGFELLKGIRMRYPTKPVVLVAGKDEDHSESIGKVLDFGACTILYKPFEKESLVCIVDEITRNKL